MPNKLTDTDVKKALECAIRNDCDCNCVFLLPNKVQDVLDLINRLQAELEDLREIVFTDRTEAFKLLKAEAYKEFAERLKENWQDNDYYWEEADVYKWIDNLLKELGGEKNA